MIMRKFRRHGYTLIEMMLVVVLIGIMGRIAFTKVSLSRFKADGAMRVVQAVLQQAERTAVQRQMEVMISFDTVGQRVRTLYDANGNHAVDAGEEVHWRALEEGNRFSVPSVGVNGAVSKSIAGSNLSVSPEGYPTVYYHRDGASSAPVEVYLRAWNTDTNAFRALVVTQATGRVDIYNYGNGQWRKAGI
jgi:prepilin-type N-terminal cleavage/methylation domain-containing protein